MARKNFLSSVFKHGHFGPTQLWYTTLAFASVLLVGGLLADAWLFTAVRNTLDASVQTSLPSTKSILNDDVISQAIAIYEQKAKTLGDLLKNPPQFVDPSR